MHAQHRIRLAQLQTEADNLAGAARKISDTIAETLARGGSVSIQPQIAFITGSMLRMMKDWGVIEQLQQQGTQHRPTTRPAAVRA
jgi:hypothetical protein